MGHNIEAIIAKRPVNELKLRELGLAAAFEGEFVIVILYPDAMDALPGIGRESVHEEFYIPQGTLRFLTEVLGIGDFALIKTDYFGGMGYQYALLGTGGTIVSEEPSINSALRKIGVVAAGGKDEFDTINLGEYRGDEEYYWKGEDNFALRKPNMIPGRLVK